MASPLHQLAQAAGIAVHWVDAFGQPQRVHEDSLRAILTSLQLPADSDRACTEALRRLATDSSDAMPAPMRVFRAGESASLLSGALRPDQRYRVTLENGALLEGRLLAGAGNEVRLEPITVTGYHAFECGDVRTTLAVAPRRSFGVTDALSRGGRGAGDRLWGLAAQLYSLRRHGDGGLADFTALEALAGAAAAAGASALATSPVHAMFTANPARFSPYGPSSRLFSNVFHIDPAGVFGAEACQAALARQPAGSARWAELEKTGQVDWPGAAALRLAVLRDLFGRYRRGNLKVDRERSDTGGFAGFCQSGGQALLDHATYEALDAWHVEQGQPQGDWRQWPAQFHDPHGPAVREFAGSRAEEVNFHQFLQWLADEGRAAVQARAADAGMAIGVVADLAVGADPGGSQAWGLQSATLPGLTVGAPPDLLALKGQNWGLGALSPLALKQQGFAAWLAMLRANMRHAGGIRIDHVLGLARLWLVPQGADASHGAYLHYPIDDLLKLTALESVRHSAVVIGEDMGTIPPGFSEQISEAGVMGIRALWFQRDGARFLPPEAWPDSAMATTSTHDLATVAGWWQGRDIDWRERLELFTADTSADDHRTSRATERGELWGALRKAGCADATDPPDAPPLEQVLMFIGSTPAPLVMIPLEDVFGIVEQPNLPGTVETHPNWQQRLPKQADDWLREPEVAHRLAALDRSRKELVAAPPVSPQHVPVR